MPTDVDRVAENLRAVESHFHSEARNEVEAALGGFTDDIVWEAPALNGLDRAFSGKAAVAENYRRLFASMRDVRFQFLQRFATEDRVVDDSIVTFEVATDGYWRFPCLREGAKPRPSDNRFSVNKAVNASFCEAASPVKGLQRSVGLGLLSSCVRVWGEMVVILLFALDDGGPRTAAHGGVRSVGGAIYRSAL